MNLKLRLTVLQFLEFFIWGSWLISFGNYLFHLGMGDKIGTLFATTGIASFIMPTLVGIIADRWLNSEKLLGILHLLGAGCFFLASQAVTFNQIYLYMFLNALVFMPTIGLSYSVCYSIMARHKMNLVKDFPPIRVWGTVGFIVAMWVVNLAGWGENSKQLLLAGASALVLGVYSFTLPPSPPAKAQKGSSLMSVLGLDALILLKEKKMAVFFLFAVLLGVCLQIANSYGSAFLGSFASAYPDAFAVKYNNIFLSISQIAEALFILVIPFFMRKFGIKTVMLMSLGAWVLRFGLFGIGNPEGAGMIWLTLSMIMYGMAFDFFNIAGSLFIEKETPAKFRSSAQGLLMMVTSGLGAIVGNYGAEAVVNYHTVDKNQVDWPACWFIFAGYALVVGILFAACFKRNTENTDLTDLH
ncbi:MAG: Xanthosine permease [Candidatus Ordinivivax streblomastigis]|uniref:Xanthosine permease n=1 Tax=Candidatus Ordinivivax streblomastigis TaxID=2540710 RepID=A0A5M8NUL8_9BACT|nr:MAG: Xanthosine permease [Candidatus Ordinivivax streblomastigis]